VIFAVLFFNLLMASNTFDINLVVFTNYICSFYIDFRFMFVMFPRLYQNLRRLLVVSYFVKFGRFAAQMRSDAFSKC